MNRDEIKEILMSLRTAENEGRINNLLGKIDLLTDEKIESIVEQIGDNKENIRRYLQERIGEGQAKEEHTPINKMFTYGVSGGSIHLHMPVDLHQMMAEKGMSKTIDTVNLYLLDAIEKIRKLQEAGYYRFQGKDSIYMISPVLIGREMRFLEEMDFKTKTYKKKELQDEKFISEHPEAMLAIHIFGKERNVGTAIIGLDRVNSEEWQKKKAAKIKEFGEKGITLNEDEKEIYG